MEPVVIDAAVRNPDPKPWRSWWIGRCWMVVGGWLLVSGVIGLLVWAYAFFAGETEPSTFEIALMGLLLGGTGWACVWAGKQRFARVADRPDVVQRLFPMLRTPRVLAWTASTVVAVVTALILAHPWIDSVSTVQWLRRSSGIECMDRIHDLHGHGVGYWGFASGHIDSRDLGLFIEQNQLLPITDRESWSQRRTFEDWEKHWPAHPVRYAREGLLPNDTNCVGQYVVLCMVDRRSGRAWIAVEAPDWCD